MRGDRIYALFCAFFLVGCGTSTLPPKPADPLILPVSTPSPEPLPTPTLRPVALPVNPPEYPYPTPTAIPVVPFEVAGHVLSRGRGIGGIRLSLINNSDWRTISIVTATDGSYKTEGLPAGNYFIHYYNDSDNGKIGFWKTLSRPVDAQGGSYFLPFDVFLVGMKNTPGQGGSVALPFNFRWAPYATASYLRFRVHDAGGPGGKALYISERLPADTLTFSYDGTINQSGWNAEKLESGRRFLWGIYYDGGDAGEGGNLYQDFIP